MDHITTSVSATTGLSPDPMFQYTKPCEHSLESLHLGSWHQLDLGCWLCWFVGSCSDAYPMKQNHKVRGKSNKTLLDWRLKFATIRQRIVDHISDKQRCRSGTITFRDASAYLCTFSNFTTRGGKSGGCEPAAPCHRVGLVEGCGRCHGGGHTTGAHGLGTHHAGIRSGRIASETMIDLIN